MASLQELKEKGIRLSASEEEELNGKQDEWYSELRVKGFYRVFDTFFKDYRQCTEFYATGFINAEDGYEWLISLNEDSYESEDDEDIYDVYLVLKTSTKWERKERKMFTGTAEEVLEFTKRADKKDYKIANRWNNL